MKDRADLLFEIGCEEIPAEMIPEATAELKLILEKYLQAERLLDSEIETFGAPRRLTAIVSSMRTHQENITREVTGPPRAVAFDNVGAPTRAAESFASKRGVPVASLFLLQTPKGEYLAARQIIPGRAASEILPELFPQVIRELKFPRSMYWTSADGPRFIRPIRWIVALLGGQVLPFQFAGISSGRESAGHRFLGKARVPIQDSRDYEKRLERNFVLVNPVKRLKKIEVELRQRLGRSGWRVHPDPDLLRSVVYLNEYPSVIFGSFDPAFLDLPDEILITVMRGHQKYFAIEDRKGSLVPHFLAVVNLDKDKAGLIRAGHERVLRARFSDARFFWDADQKVPLASQLPRLAQVTYETRLGSYGDKIERVRRLARWAADVWFGAGIPHASVSSSDRAAELSKCDLVTEMVHELPELQGIVGGLYAMAQGEPEEVAWAVYDQYRPAGMDDAIPRNITGWALGLSDRLDSLVACFAVGAIPSGSSDPFALRRAALGIVKIILEAKIPFSLSAGISAAARTLESLPPRIAVSSDAERQVLEFLLERARYIFREKYGLAYDEVNAALAASSDDLLDVADRAKALRFIRRKESFLSLATSFKRIRKILEKAGISVQSNAARHTINPALFQVDAERELHRAARDVAQKSAVQKKAGHYREALEAIAELRPQVARFFDEVMVMAEQEDVRRNRLALLGELLREFSTIADFSEIASEDFVSSGPMK
jgi:glycyl-tRNA synthetase beta chain